MWSYLDKNSKPVCAGMTRGEKRKNIESGPERLLFHFILISFIFIFFYFFTFKRRSSYVIFCSFFGEMFSLVIPRLNNDSSEP